MQLQIDLRIYYIVRLQVQQKQPLFFRAVTLVGEKERKVLKDIVKRARNPVKSRVILQGMDMFSMCASQYIPLKIDNSHTNTS